MHTCRVFQTNVWSLHSTRIISFNTIYLNNDIEEKYSTNNFDEREQFIYLFFLEENFLDHVKGFPYPIKIT